MKIKKITTTETNHPHKGKRVTSGGTSYLFPDGKRYRESIKTTIN